MNILDAAQKHGLQVKRVGKTGKRGEEYAGPCPKCGGDDRFRINPDRGDKGGTFFCRQCGFKGDCINFLREFFGMSFADAAREVGMKVQGRQHRSPAPIMRQHDHSHQYAGGDYAYPPEAWSDKASALLQHLRGTSANIDKATDYLATRGIEAATAERFGLVWNPQQYFRPLESWGMPPETKADGSPSRLYIPAGLVIPHVVDGSVVRIRVRRDAGDPRYLLLRGSSVEPLALRSHERCLVVVETELDAMLISQAAADLVSVMATGSTMVRPSRGQCEAVRQFPMILVAFDNDANRAGDKAAAWWLDQFPQAKRFPPIGKDPGSHPATVRQWIAGRVPWGGTSANFLKKKQQGEGVKKFMLPHKCRGCWAQWPPEDGDSGEQCMQFGIMPIEQALWGCEY